jgi:hypothetical protein
MVEVSTLAPTGRRRARSELGELTLKLDDLRSGGYPPGRQHARRGFTCLEAYLGLRERDPSLVLGLVEDSAH